MPDRNAAPQARHDTARAWAASLGISEAAIELYLASEVIDLHVETFLWTQWFGYDLTRHHGHGLFGGRYYGQCDLPRARQANLTGAMWSITTNPWGRADARLDRYQRNVERLAAAFSSVPDQVSLVQDLAGYRRARQSGRHAAFVAVQGGNAFDRDLHALDEVDDRLLRVTLVHLSRSRIGRSSAGSAGGPGLTDFGRDFVRALNARRIFVDLAHLNRAGFHDAVAVHDRGQPLLVTHTGVTGVHPSWRNIDDRQLRAIADTGGVVGVVFHGYYLGGNYLSGGTCDLIVDHLSHIIDVVGDEVPALGSDFDGFIIPPRDLRSCLELPRLVQRMLDRGWSAKRIQGILGGNFLRALQALRG